MTGNLGGILEKSLAAFPYSPTLSYVRKSAARNGRTVTYDDCPGTLWTKACAYDLALVEYDVLITDGAISLRPAQGGQRNLCHGPVPGLRQLDQPPLLRAAQRLQAALRLLHRLRHGLRCQDERAPSVSGNRYPQELFVLEKTVRSRSFPDPTDAILAPMIDISSGSASPPQPTRRFRSRKLPQLKCGRPWSSRRAMCIYILPPALPC